MNRRSFLKLLGVAIATPFVGKAKIQEPVEDDWPVYEIPDLDQKVISNQSMGEFLGIDPMTGNGAYGPAETYPPRWGGFHATWSKDEYIRHEYKPISWVSSVQIQDDDGMWVDVTKDITKITVIDNTGKLEQGLPGYFAGYFFGKPIYENVEYKIELAIDAD